MIKTLPNKLLNGMCKYTTKLINDADINLHVDYDGFSALVFERPKLTMYFIFQVDTEKKTFILTTHYYNDHLELLFSETENYKSLTVALNEITYIIKTLTTLIDYRSIKK